MIQKFQINSSNFSVLCTVHIINLLINIISGILVFVFVTGTFVVIFTKTRPNYVEVKENIDTSDFIQNIEKNVNK